MSIDCIRKKKYLKERRCLQMKVLFIMLVVVLLVALAAPAFADQGGDPNKNADWGQAHKNYDGKISDAVHYLQDIADETNLGQLIKELKESLY
jgi:hypothetical protein